jgi:hypothetical protein
MLRQLIDTVFTARRALLAPDIANGELNPFRLAIATKGYQFQRKLLIPDRLGFFSPPSGPGRLKVQEASVFIFTTLFSLIEAILVILLIYTMIMTPNLKHTMEIGGWLMAMGPVGTIAGAWWVNVHRRRLCQTGEELKERRV